jgi:hypothetical protein
MEEAYKWKKNGWFIDNIFKKFFKTHAGAKVGVIRVRGEMDVLKKEPPCGGSSMWYGL